MGHVQLSCETSPLSAACIGSHACMGSDHAEGNQT